MDPDDITGLIGIKPSAVGRRGEPYITTTGKPTSKRLPGNTWKLEHRLRGRPSLGAQLEDLADQVKGVEGTFANLPRGTTVIVLCSVFLFGAPPSVKVSPAVLRFLGDTGATLKLDVT
jgi:hypothetical protein